MLSVKAKMIQEGRVELCLLIFKAILKIQDVKTSVNKTNQEGGELVIKIFSNL